MSAAAISRCISCGSMLAQSRIRPVSQTFAWHSRGFLRQRAHKDQHGGKQKNIFLAYLQSLKWVPIPLGVGFAYIGYQQYGHVVKREERKMSLSTDPEELVAHDWVVTLYKLLPLKILSRLWGKVNSFELPVWMRKPVYKSYIWAFNCDLEEAVIRDLKHYRNLGEFFKRRLRPGVRPVDKNCSIVQPSDGRILHLGKADSDLLEQVKGISYSMQDFMGPPSWIQGRSDPLEVNQDGTHCRVRPLPRKKYPETVKKNPANELYHCVIYLAPGDYHGFHSPVEWTVSYRRHFPGELFSVNPGIARLVKGLFNLNERVIYYGEWEQGFFAMAAVGATNVGSVNIFHDKHLQTNIAHRFVDGSFIDQELKYQDTDGIPLKRGDAFGEFRLGSTIIVVFEASPDFEFTVEPGQRVKYGQPLGSCKSLTGNKSSKGA